MLIGAKLSDKTAKCLIEGKKIPPLDVMHLDYDNIRLNLWIKLSLI